MADYRNGSGIVVEDGPLGPTIDDRGLEPGRSVDRPPGAARGGLVYRAAGRVQPPRPTDVGRLSREPRTPRHHAPIEDQPAPRKRRIRDHEPPHLRHRGRARRQRLGARPPGRPERPLRRGRRRHDGLRAEPHPGRRRLELDEPAGRRDPPRHRRPRGLQQAPVGLGDRAGHHDRPVRRQQQLVRGVGLLAAQAVRPPRCPDPQRRAQVLARQGPGAERRRRRRTRRPATSCPSPTSACAPSATTSCRGSATPSSRSWTSARRPSTTARSSRPRA